MLHNNFYEKCCDICSVRLLPNSKKHTLIAIDEANNLCFFTLCTACKKRVYSEMIKDKPKHCKKIECNQTSQEIAAKWDAPKHSINSIADIAKSDTSLISYIVY